MMGPKHHNPPSDRIRKKKKKPVLDNLKGTLIFNFLPFNF